jgi:hypothetical protein
MEKNEWLERNECLDCGGKISSKEGMKENHLQNQEVRSSPGCLICSCHLQARGTVHPGGTHVRSVMGRIHPVANKREGDLLNIHSPHLPHVDFKIAVRG